jgi:FkbM family methyltransferase
MPMTQPRFEAIDLSSTYKRKIVIREGNNADLGVIGQVLQGKCFEIERFHQGRVARAFFQGLVKSDKTPVIFDIGANIGASSLYFASLYPEALIVALEPEENNFDLLVKNTEGLKVKAIKGALGPRDETLFIHDPGVGEWGFQIAKDGDLSTQVFSASEFVRRETEDLSPFLLKIDIEGYEKYIFDSGDDWFHRFPVIIFEIHDWMHPFESISKNLINTISQKDYDVIFKGENLFIFSHQHLLTFHNRYKRAL